GVCCDFQTAMAVAESVKPRCADCRNPLAATVHEHLGRAGDGSFRNHASSNGVVDLCERSRAGCLEVHGTIGATSLLPAPLARGGACSCRCGLAGWLVCADGCSNSGASKWRSTAPGGRGVLRCGACRADLHPTLVAKRAGSGSHL